MTQNSAMESGSPLVFLDRAMIEARDFWRQAVPSPLPRTGLAPDFVGRCGAQTADLAQAWSEAARAGLDKVARGRVLLLQAVTAAAAAAVLGRYHGTARILLNVTLGGENEPPHLLPLKLDLDPEASVKVLLAGVRQGLVAAQPHRLHPPTQLAAEEEAGRSTFQTVAVAGLPVALESGALEPGALESGVGLVLRPGPDHLTITYDAARFAEATILRFVHQIMHFIAAALEDVEQPLGRISLLSAEERRLVLQGWNETRTALPPATTLDQMVQDRALSHPDSLAIAEAGRVWSYGALARRAAAVTRRLTAAGLGRGAIIGLCLPPTAERIAALLGIMGAGAAYLPLDPDYPTERLAFMIKDSGLQGVITDEVLRPRLSEGNFALFLSNDDEAESVASLARPEDPAYVIYTSGSTGQPKGVVVGHRGLVNLVTEQIRLLALTPNSRVLQFASFSFDAAISEVGMALAAGGCLHLAERAALLPGETLLRLLTERAITHVTLPPSSLQLLPPADLPALETLVVAGEPCPAALVEAWGGKRRFVNGYGPTEATVGTCFALCQPGEARPAIGPGIAHARLYILDPEGEPVAVGVPGELYIGGVGVALGYLGRPDLTAERFLEDSWAEQPGGRVYRTGDLVRWRADGAVEFLGRIDEQVKVRGFRIEPGEIEAALMTHPQVRDAALVVREDIRGEPQLAAFFVAGESVPSLHDLHAHLADRLPLYMLPQLYSRLDALPLTPNHKIDRSALRGLALEAKVLSGEGSRLGPRDVVELDLLRIWEDCLGRSPIGRQDNFFELGGHSMLAVRLLALIEERMGNRLDIADLFEAPNIEALAARLRHQPASKPWSPVVVITPAQTAEEGGKNATPLWLVHPAGGTVLCYGPLGIALGAERAVFGLQEYGLAEGQTPLGEIEATAALYLAAMRQHQERGPWRLAGWSFGGLVAYELARQLEAAGEQVSFLGLIDSFAPEILPKELQTVDDAQHLVDLFGADLALSTPALRRLPEGEQLAHVLDLAHASGLIPLDLGLDTARRLLDLYKANQQAVFAYRPGPITSQITLFRARQPMPGTAGEASARHPTLGWESAGGLRVHWLEGAHHSLVQPPLAAQLARLICERLDEGTL